MLGMLAEIMRNRRSIAQSFPGLFGGRLQIDDAAPEFGIASDFDALGAANQPTRAQNMLLTTPFLQNAETPERTQQPREPVQTNQLVGDPGQKITPQIEAARSITPRPDAPQARKSFGPLNEFTAHPGRRKSFGSVIPRPGTRDLNRGR